MTSLYFISLSQGYADLLGTKTLSNTQSLQVYFRECGLQKYILIHWFQAENSNGRLPAKQRVTCHHTVMDNQYFDHQATFLHIPVISETDQFRTIGELDTLNHTPLDISTCRNEHDTVDQEEIISQDSTSQEESSEASVDDNSATALGSTVKVSMT